MMTAVAEGAKSMGGLTIGLLPGEDDREANAYIDVALPTGLGAFRNALLARSCHVAIAIRGSYGTLSEIGFALRLGVPVIGLKTWSLSRDGLVDERIRATHDPAEAVELAFELGAPAR
jgi:uncharacterized protein (TIGR00725 family)